MDDKKLIKKEVERAYALTSDSFDWKPYYPNNMVGNGCEGYYCIFRDVSGKPVRKFTILFQYAEDEDFVIRDKNDIDSYILFSENLSEDFKEYPEPVTDEQMHDPNFKFTDDNYDVNNHGSFLHACKTLEEAKERVVVQCKMIFGYCMSFLIPPDDDDDSDGDLSGNKADDDTEEYEQMKLPGF